VFASPCTVKVNGGDEITLCGNTSDDSTVYRKK
jgi:hypothetical protein